MGRNGASPLQPTRARSWELLAEVEAEKRANGKKGKKKKKGGGAGGAGPSQEPEEGTEAPSEADAAEAAKKAEEARLLLLLETLTEERMRFGITAESQAAAAAEVAEAARLAEEAEAAEEEAEAEDEAAAEEEAVTEAAAAAAAAAVALAAAEAAAAEAKLAAAKEKRAATAAARAKAAAARMATPRRMETRGGDDETRLLRRRVQEMEQANLELKSELADVERRRRHLAGMVFRLQRRNAVLSAAAEQRSGAVSFLKKGSGLWSRQVHILSTMLARWHVDNVVELCLKTLYFMRSGHAARTHVALVDPEYAEAVAARNAS
ncbi:hypothetical protein EMIHUDRAFT_98879 [Emiliania huxleyi CCMP1516]|uniref:Uncharacterized protein n=2 Tax=Emiliania huxleyi TaxID=2903 RepID=A0A0D3KBQ2_EMIH1|nr:hypothetical protein EMIHUDRAFT_98879 [Emiliania huxleyi CCMP1516]EOD33187.1 hypothetical protein EMIHUDRAFT_98879 [Emiliania huxleyi CCMP1516]|eukprot:XP_005785616.1 hypothetical protein EMIHUDRAFT_98879 [Emiliania huxleyi CCMP1516]